MNSQQGFSSPGTNTNYNGIDHGGQANTGGFTAVQQKVKILDPDPCTGRGADEPFRCILCLCVGAATVSLFGTVGV